MPLIRKPSGPAASNEPDVALSALISGTAEERWSAARAAADLPGGVRALALALTTETDARVREAVFTSLVRIGTAESVDVALLHLRSDDASLRTGALDALRAMPDAVKPFLPALFRDVDPDVRLLACELARNTPTARESALLTDLLDREAEANVCAAAVEVLAEIGGPDVIPALTRCAARFPNDPFLGFAVTQTVERLSSRPPRANG